MLRMFTHLKKYAWTLVLIVALLGAQAVCDLTLPSYTAAIVNVGIQQQGVAHSAPLFVRESTLAALMRWMPSEDAAEYIQKNYQPISVEEAQKQGVTKTDEPVLALGKVTEEVQQKLDLLFDKALTIQSVVSGESMIDIGSMLSVGGAETPQLGATMPTPEQMESMMAAMTDAQRDEMLRQMDERLFDLLPESMLSQAANQAVRNEYVALGIDMNQWQSRSIWSNGLIMLLIALAGTVASVMVGYLGSRIAARLGRNLRKETFTKVVHFGQQEMEKFSTASLITRSTNDIQQVQMVMVMLLRIVIYAPIIGVGGVLRAMETNQSMSWIIFVAVLTVIAIVMALVAVAMPRFKSMQTLIDKVNLVMRETLTGLPVIRAFCTQKREEERFDEASTRLKKTQLFVNRLMSGMMPLMMLVMNGVAVLIMWVGAHSMESGGMQVGDMMAYIQYTMQIIMAFLMISMMSVMLPRASVAAKRIQEVLDTDISVQDPANAVAFEESKRGVVEFQDVSFRYPGAEEDMLSHISFTAKPGETTAILGGTGSGKSTLINLVPRFFDVTGGKVLVDGIDVREATLEDLRSRIGYVPQKGVLFTGTVKENLTFGSEEIPMERLQEATRIAQAEGFVLEREDGYDSQVAQGGANVSGGQKQRLSIARAIAKNPEVYIFDDSFSALDFKTDAAVRTALFKAERNATMMIVAQRISTVMHADQILVLDDGKLVGKGTHDELMRSCEVYGQIATSQLSKEELSHAN